METTRKYRVGHAKTEAEALTATGIPRVGDKGPKGTVTRLEVLNNNNRCFLVTAFYEDGKIEETEVETDSDAPAAQE
jgi:hypothetical protein